MRLSLFWLLGFTTFWLGSVLGKSLLTLVRDVGPMGSVFIFGAWKMLVFAFEILTIIVGKKASRFNSGSVFSFCAIYTGGFHMQEAVSFCAIMMMFLCYFSGAIYAEFIFLSVEFNSPKFWALLAIEFAIIVTWQGGMQIDLTNFVVAYFNSEYAVLKFIKFQVLTVLGEIPVEIAEQVSCYTYQTAPPDMQLALIRSRAMVVQVSEGIDHLRTRMMCVVGYDIAHISVTLCTRVR